jgi:signal transduction histidine kinase
LFSVSVHEVLRTATFRTAATVAATFAIATLLLFAFIFWQTAGYENRRTDGYLYYALGALGHQDLAQTRRDIEGKFAGDPHRLTFAALFDAAGLPLAGNLVGIPAGFALDGQPHRIDVVLKSGTETTTDPVRAIGIRLPSRSILIVGRSQADLNELTAVIQRALTLGLVPATILALVGGAIASRRFLARIQVVNNAIDGIMQGDLNERLPVRHYGDAVDRLSTSINAMLDEIVRLLAEVKGVGDNIAHDLRTPLTRLRSRLEGGVKRAASHDELEQIVYTAINDLDQSFAVITALLRIGEIESSRRRAGFAEVNLTEILNEAADLYAPVAELKNIVIGCETKQECWVWGDRDLLFEVVANLVDNAVKFTPPGGNVALRLLPDCPIPTLRVQDSGPGIPPHEHAAVAQRFYRSDPSRHVPGSGLGLSLVAAILRLHGFKLSMSKLDQGFAVDVACAPVAAH